MKRTIRASTLVMVFNCALSSSHFGELDFEDANWVEELNSRLLINSMSIPNPGVGPGDPLVIDITVECGQLDQQALSAAENMELEFTAALGDTSCAELLYLSMMTEEVWSPTAMMLFLKCAELSVLSAARLVCTGGQTGRAGPTPAPVRKLQGPVFGGLLVTLREIGAALGASLAIQAVDENILGVERSKTLADRIVSFGSGIFENFIFAGTFIGESFKDCDGGELEPCTVFCKQWLLIPEGLKILAGTSPAVIGVAGVFVTGGISGAVGAQLASAITVGVLAADAKCARCSRAIELRGDCSDIDYGERGCSTRLSCAGFRNSCRYLIKEATQWYTITSSTGGQCTMAPDGSPDVEVESYNDIEEPENINWKCSSLIAKNDVPYLPPTQPGVMELCPKGNKPLLFTPENCGPTNVQIIHSFGSYRVEGTVGGLLDSNTILWSRDCDVTGALADCPDGGTVYASFEGSPCCKLPEGIGEQGVDCTCGTIGQYLFWSAPCLGQFNDPPTGDICVGDPGRCFG